RRPRCALLLSRIHRLAADRGVRRFMEQRPITRRGFMQAVAAAAAWLGLPARARAGDLASESGLELWYGRPAAPSVQARPGGNGRLGAMIFGDVIEERLQLNEDTLWSGAPREWDNPKAKDVLPDIRRAVTDGRYVDADQLSKGMMGPFTESYQPLGD